MPSWASPWRRRPSAGRRSRCGGRRAAAPAAPRCRSRSRPPAACRPCGLAAARDLARPREIRVVVDLDPLDTADRRDADAPPAVDQLLEAVLVVERRVAAPGRLERL